MNLLHKIKQTLHYLRLRPFDTSTSDGREQERHRRIAISSASAFVGQGINYVVMIVMVPLLIKYLGQEQYGLWLAISAMATFTAFADLGLGNGLINVLGKAHGQDDQKVAREYVSSGFFILVCVAVVLGIVGGFVFPLVDWNHFFQLKSDGARAYSSGVVLIFFILFALNLPLSIVQKIQMAYQENYLNSLWMAAGKLCMLAGAIVGVLSKQSLLYFVVVLAGAPVLMWLINSLVLFGRNRPWLRPSLRFISRSSSKELLKTGFYFFITGLAGVLAIQIDTLVIGRYLGAEQVPVYAIPLRLFMICTTLLSFVLMPLWPAYREAIVRGDMQWVSKTFWRTMKITLIFTIPSAVLLVFITPFIVRVWTGKNLMIPMELLLALAMYAIMTAVTGPMAMLLNGANVLRGRAFFVVISGFANLFLSIAFVQKFGVSGPVWGTVLTQLFIGWPIAFYYIYQYFTKTRLSAMKV